MRCVPAAVLCALLLGSSAAAAPTTPSSSAVATSTASSTLVITGHGYGHGVGMGQWGAYGYALHGWSAEKILGHYYSGTTVGTAPVQIVRVLLQEANGKVALGSTGAWSLVDGVGQELNLPAGPLDVPASLQVDGRTLVSPVMFSPGKQPVEVGKSAYRGGLLVVSNGKHLQVVNVVDLESYLQGVVGSEVPSTWPSSALEAQAIAARSYALAKLETVVTSSPFSLYSDGRSQVYGGIAAETPATTKAVQATAGKVVLYQGKVATTYFSSSSGGETAPGVDRKGEPLPYLAPVSDPYDSLSPYHDWGPVLVSAKDAGKALGLDAPLLDLQPAGPGSGHVATATAVDSEGTKTLTGTQVQSDLGLRSTMFELGWLSLTPPAGPVPSGGTLTLSGAARGMAGVSVQMRVPGAAWQTLGPVSPDSTGAFTVQVSPVGTTWYRLASGRVRGALIRIETGGVVTAAVGQDAVTGAVSAKAAGAPIFLDRKDGSTWITVSTAIAGTDGTFAFRPLPTPGTYRVRCKPGHGLPAGATSVLTISQ
jgi:stage II sporulation protein D